VRRRRRVGQPHRDIDLGPPPAAAAVAASSATIWWLRLRAAPWPAARVRRRQPGGATGTATRSRSARPPQKRTRDKGVETRPRRATAAKPPHAKAPPRPGGPLHMPSTSDKTIERRSHAVPAAAAAGRARGAARASLVVRTNLRACADRAWDEEVKALVRCGKATRHVSTSGHIGRSQGTRHDRMSTILYKFN